MPEPGIDPLFYTTGYVRCPGGPGVNINLNRAEADCPGCGQTFTTLADDPTFPPHFVSEDGQVVTFNIKWERQQ